MPVIKPISDLRNYNQVLEKVSLVHNGIKLSD